MLLHGGVRRLLLQALLLLLCATAETSSTSHVDDDETALVAIKAKISRRDYVAGALSTWNQSTAYCSWEGVTCGRRRVVALDLSSQGLDGTISPAIGNLTFLRWINLGSNALHGEIPPSIGALGRLRSLNLSDNVLAGAIPANISGCASLRVLDISSNKGVQGSIPAGIGGMPSLTALFLFNNSFTGTIPPSLGNLSRLSKLSLSVNYLEGPVPAAIGNNPHLSVLQLSINNLSGLLPPSVYNLSSLYYFYVAQNKLHGRLPSDMGKSLPSMQSMGIGGNRFTGALPLSVTNMSRLQKLYAGFNTFTGIVPSGLGRLQDLRVFVLDFNMFEASNEQDWEFIASLTNCSRLQMLSIGGNRFAGKLPGSLANLTTNLQWLRTPSNYISGVIPPDIGNLASLANLDFDDNILTGPVPESIGKLTELSQLYLYSNNFSGRLPSSVGNLTGLSELDAHGNSLEGPIPPSIGNLSKLSALDLSRNKLIGVIPYEIMELSSITIVLDLSYNLLEGPLPFEVGGLVNLARLILSGNKFSGGIPSTIGNCKVLEVLLMDDNSFQGIIPSAFKDMAGLTILNLTNNKLNGSIPSNLGTLAGLQELYLAHNNLSGSIPKLLGNSTSLIRLDLSFNNLQGELPEEGIFRNLTGLSIVGNNALCGGITQLHLPKCPSSSEKKNKEAKIKSLKIAIPIVGALLLILLLGLVWAGFHYTTEQRAPNTACRDANKEIAAQFAEIELPNVPYRDILTGTNEFSEANVLGKGRYGTVYKCTLDSLDIIVAVKVFNVQQSGSYKSFHTECEALKRVRHRCLVKIITCCSGINHKGEEFRALVFEFMANGSLDRWIHSDLECQNGQRALSLSQRLDIAVDIMDALDYLHNGCEPSIIHCDLKPSNILLNQNLRGCVADFGIAKVLDEETNKRHLNSSSTRAIRGSIGYIAPEYGEGLAVSTYGDVFSFGVTLIEMFTGKSPTDEMFRDGINLHYYAEAALPDKVMEIADSKMLLHSQTNNKNDIWHITGTRECLSAVIQLGILCSKQLPTERLSTSNAAAEMHDIRDKYINSSRQLSDVKLY